MTDESTPEDLAAQFKKDELKAAAAVSGVEVASSDTKADIAEKLVDAGVTDPTPAGSAGPTSQPVQVDGRNRKSEDDALEGHFVKLDDGRFAAFLRVLEREADGYPKQILVRTRDELNELLSVAYKAVKHAGDYHGGR